VAGSEGFRQSLKGMENIYGDGQAAARIVAVLASAPLGEELLVKKAV
jgi:UDP-N-acetylglucosamine 2-epimerase (non-hydrolysing)/GDP/UDP-N,N'-diacetylbacillosamine 2-epimerase (hydrolysing)